jgi:hypothetical protein
MQNNLYFHHKIQKQDGYQSINRVTIFVEMAYSFFILKLSKDTSPENTFKPVKYSHYIITANE